MAGYTLWVGSMFVFYWVAVFLIGISKRIFPVGSDGSFLLSNGAETALTVGIGIVAVASAAGTFLAGRAAHMRGRKLLAVAKSQAAAVDQRPPVLYLRSFEDDEKAATGVRQSGLQILFGSATEEEQLSRAMNELGPFVSIGRPGEQLPELGAARFYVSHEEWHERVRDLMSRCQLAVLRVGRTPGFFWEVRNAVESIAPQKLIFLLPYDPDIYAEFRRLTADSFPRGLPEFQGGPSLGGSYLGGILHFDADWTPHILRFKVPLHMTTFGQILNPPGWYFGALRLGNPFISVFKRTLKPVLEQNGLKWKWPPRHPLLTLEVWMMLAFWALAAASCFHLTR